MKERGEVEIEKREKVGTGVGDDEYGSTGTEE